MASLHANPVLTGAVVRVAIGLGANLGDPSATLEAACDALAALPACTWVGRSAWFRSAPVDAGGPDFRNAVVVLDTALAPLAVLEALQAIEARHGRQRPYRNAPRTLDLDLLIYGDQTVDDERLTVPHPRWLQRAFVLLPLLEVWPTEALFSSPATRAHLLAERVVDPAALQAHAASLASAQGIDRLG